MSRVALTRWMKTGSSFTRCVATSAATVAATISPSTTCAARVMRHPAWRSVRARASRDSVARPGGPAPPASPRAPRPRPRTHSGPPAVPWPLYGYGKARRAYLPVSAALRPPYARLWSVHTGVLLEFTPVVGGRSLYILDNKGVLRAIARRRGPVRWTRRLGTLAASAPAYAPGRG